MRKIHRSKAVKIPQEITESRPKRRRPLEKTDSLRESRLINLSYKVAEKQMMEGKISSQVLVHFLKLGSRLAELELEKMKQETVLLQAKTSSLKSQENSDKAFKEAIAAVVKYSGASKLESPKDENL